MSFTSPITQAKQTYGDVTRAAEILSVLAKYGLAGWLADTEWEVARKVLRGKGGEWLTDHPLPVRVRLALTDLGTAFVKLGQLLSTRPDVVGQDIADELTKLQSSARPDSIDVVRGTIEAELGSPMTDFFASFDEAPLGSASIGQVHRAVLKDGTKVVVKVQHPGIEEVVRRDLSLLQTLAKLAAKSRELASFQPESLVREFSRSLLNELDFTRELRHLQQFRANFGCDETICFPEPFPALTTKRMLVMTEVSGRSVRELGDKDELPVDRETIAKRGAAAFIEMIFRDGFYHADPHPGNFLVQGDGRIILLDAGMVGRVDGRLRGQIEEILLAVGDQDAEALTDAILEACAAPVSARLEPPNRTDLSSDLVEFFGNYGSQNVGAMNVGAALNDVTAVLHAHGLLLPSRLSLLIKCLVLLEGTAKLLSPNFNLTEVLKPYRTRFIKEKFSPRARLKQMRRLSLQWQRLASNAPQDIAAIVARLQAGEAKVQLSHRGLERSVNRVVVGIMASALLVGSALLWSNGARPPFVACRFQD
ncbi:MAG: AarF/UbiB family protein [Tepidisphaeraceae bacterium]